MGGAASRRDGDGPDSPRGFDDRSPPDSPLVTPRSPLTFGCGRPPEAPPFPAANRGEGATTPARRRCALLSPTRCSPRRVQAAGAHGAHAAAVGL